MTIAFKEIEGAFFFVSSASESEHHAFLDRETGKTYWQSEMLDDMEELPEDIEDDRYIAIPHKIELDLGKRLVLEFACAHLPDEVEEIAAIFRRKGAYGRFKALLGKRMLCRSGMISRPRSRRRPCASGVKKTESNFERNTTQLI